CRMHKLIILIFIVIAATSFGQEVMLQGTCVDKENKGIPGIRIRVNDAESAIYSEDGGGFFIPSKVEDSIHLECYYSVDRITVTKDFVVASSDSKTIPPVQFNVKTQVVGTVNVIHEIEKPFEIKPLIIADWQTLPVMNIER